MFVASRNVNRKKGRTRPLARQRPFDITMCSKERFTAGDPIFTYESTTDAAGMRNMENSTFTAGVSLKRLSLKSTEKGYISDKTTVRLVGFCYADSTGKRPSMTTRTTDDWTHVPVTIAGNMTTTMQTLTDLLDGGWRETSTNVPVIKSSDIYGVTKVTVGAAAANKIKELHAGSMIRVGDKVIRLIDPYKQHTQGARHNSVTDRKSVV